MRLYLIRHGRTLANELHLYCGATDVCLSDKGVEELRKLHYDIPKNCRFLTSGMKRTQKTLEILFGDVPFEVDERFREMDFGVFEMGSYESLQTREDYQNWITGDNEANVCPEGESGYQMRERVLDGLQDLLASDKDVVLVAHGGTIAIIMEALFSEEGKNRYEWQPKPGHGYLVEGDGYRAIPV